MHGARSESWECNAARHRGSTAHGALLGISLLGILLMASGCQGEKAPSDAREAPSLGSRPALTTVTPICVAVQRTGSGGAVQDTQIADVAGGEASQYGTSWTVNSGMVGSPPHARQALFRFDLSGAPPGALATSAAVTLYQTNNATSTVSAHRVLAPWDETPATTWTSFNGAFAPAVAGSFVNGPPNLNITAPTPISFALDLALVQGWLDGSLPNYGILLEQPLVGSERTTYRTSEWQPVAQRPLLSLCYTVACSAGFADCDADPQNGCEASLASTTDCGACGNTCSAPNGTPACIGGACAVGACNPGWGDCDGSIVNGCETQLDTVADCGACGHACSVANGTAACTSGTCAVGACNAGNADCDGDPANGCEASLGSVAHCGACGNACSVANGTPACLGGACAIAMCDAGWGDCDGDSQNGCETPLDTTGNCGACGHACSAAHATAACAAGSCTMTACDPGWGDCDGDTQNGCETDLSDPTNCGACGYACSVPHAVSACTGGQCAVGACDPGWGDCDTNAVNGCEMDLSSDASNCGACGQVCDDGNACTTDACSAGSCVTSPAPDGTPCQGGTCAGGACSNATCSDGIQNQGEDDIDCGGPCAPCNVCLTTSTRVMSSWLGLIDVDAQGTVAVPDPDNYVVRLVDTGGQVVTIGSFLYGYQDGPAENAQFGYVTAAVFDGQGNVLVADSGNYVIRRIAPDGSVSTIAGSPGVYGYADGPAASAQFQWITDLEADGQGNVYILDSGASVVRMLDTNGDVTTVAGTPNVYGHADGPAATAQFAWPSGITRDASGDLYVAESSGSTIRKIDTNGQVTTIAGRFEVYGSNDGPGANATFDGLSDIAIDGQGNLLVTASYSATIRKIAPNGTVSTPYGSAYHYDTIDGCATKLALYSPYAIAIAPDGSILFTEYGSLRTIGHGQCDCSQPTCYDHTQNQGEEGIDCGGPCSDVCPSCSDGIQNQGEIDVDCGGPCPLCGLGTACTVNAACATGLCLNGVCAEPSCGDGLLNQGEIDIDCGGPCPLCATGRPCTVGAACASGICTNGECQAASCFDGIKNNGEADADCGGPCPLCAQGVACAAGAGCQSGVCTNGQCQAPTCYDGVQNGGEIDADCGGDCGLCPAGKHCITGADCTTGVCQANVCRPVTCSNGMQDGAESDIDCGGSCAGCAAGRACGAHSDCASDRCVGGVCMPPPVPSAIDPTVPTDMGSSIAFLYTGVDPVQAGVAPGTISPDRVSVASGKVLDRNGAPISDVKVTVLGHPEFGHTHTRADGVFEMALNGGGPVTLAYQKPGFIPVQRQVDAPWVDFATAPDVVMIALDPAVTSVDLENATTTQVAQGTVTVDADGARQATAIFEPGTAAEMVFADGTRRALTSISVRATEYTVGLSGPQAMPAALPPMSGYTYAVELSADQAFLAGAKELRFSRPVPIYVDNFLNFPTGAVVPLGYYDKERGAWVASDNGVIVEILSITAGLADLDVDGSGLAASAQALFDLGIYDGERAEIAVLYGPGARLWRAPVTHFTPWDCNWPYGPPPDASPPPPRNNPNNPNNPNDPNNNNPSQPPDPDRPCGQGGSVIECEPQVLGERIPVQGTPFHLEYSTRTMAGRGAARDIDVKVSDASVPASLKRIELEISVGGQKKLLSFAPSANQSYKFQWDGKDSWGRAVRGTFDPSVKLRYVYGAVYYASTMQWNRSFALAAGPGGSAPGSGVVIGGNRDTAEISSEVKIPSKRLVSESVTQTVGGWSLDVHRSFQQGQAGKVPVLNVPRRQLRLAGVINTSAGGAQGVPGLGDGGPASNAELSSPEGVSVGPDGSLYIADSLQKRVRKVTPDGVMHTIAGCDDAPSGGISIASAAPSGATPASAAPNAGTGAQACDGAWVTYDCDECPSCCNGGGYGSPDSATQSTKTVFEPVTPKSCKPGSGTTCTATRTSLPRPSGVAVGPDGLVYVADLSGGVYRIENDGTLVTIAGTPGDYPSFGGDGGPALDAGLAPQSIVVTRDGAIYLADLYNGRIRRIGPEGNITTVAGNGNFNHTGDGGLATEAAIGGPQSLAVAPDGTVYFSALGPTILDAGAIRKIGADGIITTIAGNNDPGSWSYPDYSGANALLVTLTPGQIALAPDGTLYFDNRELLYRMGPDGFLQRVAGRQSYTDDGDSGPATTASISSYQGLAVGPDGKLHVSTNSGRVRTISAYKAPVVPPPPSWFYVNDVTLVPVDDQVFVFDSVGRHQKTVNRTTAGAVYDFFYDPQGRLEFIEGEHGELTQILRDGSGKPTGIRAPGGALTALSIGSDGYLASVTDPSGHAVQMTYAPGGLLATFTDARSGLHRFTYDTRGNLVKDESPSGGYTMLSRAEVANGYEVTATTALGRIKRYRIQDMPNGDRVRKIVDENGGTTDATLRSNGTLTVVEPDGTTHVTTLTTHPAYGMLDPLASQETITPPSGPVASTARTFAGMGGNIPAPFSSFQETMVTNGRTWTKTYDQNSRTLTVLGEDGSRKTVVAYDPAGRIASVSRIDPATLASEVRTRTYDSAGYLVSSSGPSGSWSFGYDAQNRLASATDALGHTMSVTYDANSWPLTITDANGVVTALIHDAEKHVLSSTTAGTTTTYTYDARGNRVTETLPDGSFVTNLYDIDGRLVGTDDSSGAHQSITLDGLGNPTREDIYDAGATLRNRVQRAFDSVSRVTSVTSGAGQQMTYTYARDHVASVTDGIGNTQSFAYDVFDVLQQNTDALSASTYHGWDSLINLQTVYDAQGGVTSYQYDGLHRRVSVSSPDSGTTMFTHDGFGRMTSRTDARGVTTTYGRDAMGRITSQTYSTGSPGVVYGYDQGAFGKGQLTSVVEGSGTTAFTYDALGRITAETRTIGGVTWVTTKTYDAAGRVSTVALSPGGAQITYVRDAAGRVTDILASDGTSQRSLASGITTLPFGPVSGMTLGNGVGVVSTFDQDYRPTRFAAGTVLDKTLAYDAAGRLTSIGDAIQPGESQTFTYDAAGSLTTAVGAYGNETYAYDFVGNRTSTSRNGAVDSYSYGPASQRLDSVAGANPEAFTYDANGNATSVGGLTLAYDENNRLAQASSGGQVLAVYEHSVRGHRVKKTDANGNVTVYLYDGLQLIATADGAGNVIEQHVYLGGMRVAVLRHGDVGAADVTYVVDDQRGAAQVLLDQAGQVVWRGSYRPFGEVTFAGATGSNDFRLAGQLYDAETGFFDNGLRTYDPRTGRYLQGDPIGLSGGINTYTYVSNSPLLWVDPMGLWKIGGSAYGLLGLLGGGASISRDSDGFSICIEGGVGAGSSFTFSPDAASDPTSFGGEISAEASYGPLTVGGGLTAKLTPCGSETALEGSFGVGPTSVDGSVSLDDRGEVDGDLDTNYSLKPKDWKTDKPAKPRSRSKGKFKGWEAEAKAALKGCVRF